jgi:DNA-binding Lrp family transcriptional regulator
MRRVREVLRLKFVGGVPNREIARRLGVAPSTVRETLKRFAAAAGAGASEIAYEGADQAAFVNALVLIEAPVLGGNEGVAHIVGDFA